MPAGMAHAAGVAEVQVVSLAGGGFPVALGPLSAQSVVDPRQKSGGAPLLGLGRNYVRTSPQPWNVEPVPLHPFSSQSLQWQP